ncbi:MAG: LPS export ABC transporter periplasmic protein LptC [Betaproteobacteria bacterium]|nr:LPS export ABC transporter periplasmic protein LptC [Betaproteobacteria bacterium]
MSQRTSSLFSTLFPLGLLLALTGLTFWLMRVVENPENPEDRHLRHDPDYIVEALRLRKLDHEGRLRQSLTAARLTHYPDDDSTEVETPVVVFTAPDKPDITLQAQSAEISANGEAIYLKDEVRLKRDPRNAGEMPIVGEMPDLTVLTEDELAVTNSPVLITQGRSYLRGVGMKVDHKEQTYTIESQARGEYLLPETRKPPATKSAPPPASKSRPKPKPGKPIARKKAKTP